MDLLGRLRLVAVLERSGLELLMLDLLESMCFVAVLERRAIWNSCGWSLEARDRAAAVPVASDR